MFIPHWYKLLWGMGRMLDFAHIPLAILVLVLGPLWLPLWLYGGTVVTIALLQVAIQACPLTVFTHWLKHWHQPDQPEAGVGSLTSQLYHRFGRKIVLPLVAVPLGVGIIVAFMFR